MLDYTLFDIAGADELIILSERFKDAEWILFSDELLLSKKVMAEKQDSILTSTEQEILKLIALGRTTKEIASERFSSTHTIITHRKNIFRKLAVNNVHEATKYALRAGIVDSAEYYI